MHIEPSLLLAEQSQLYQPLICQTLQSLGHLHCILLDILQDVCVTTQLEGLEWNTVLHMYVTRAEQRGKITSLGLLTTLCLMQPRMLMAFMAAIAHCYSSPCYLPGLIGLFFFLQCTFVVVYISQSLLRLITFLCAPGDGDSQY